MRTDILIQQEPYVRKVSDNDKAAGPDIDGSKKDPGDAYSIETVDMQGSQKRNVDENALQDAVNKMVKTLMGDSTSLRFEIHKPTNTIMVKVVDDDTQQVIREIPSEKMLDMVASIWKLVGIIIDQKA